MLIISHRGHCATARENTLEAFEHALALGADGIETDLRVTTDGEIVLFHNRRVHDGRAVAELTHAELSAVAGHAVPRLEDALAISRDILWNLEIKTSGALETIVAKLPAYLKSHRILISSARHDLVETIAATLDVECGLVVANRPSLFPLPVLMETPGPGRIHTVAWSYEWLDPVFVDEAHRRGVQLLIWDVETLDEYEHCRALKVAGVITDHIEIAKLVAARASAA